MHDESPQSRRGGRPDESSESAFDALGLSALFGDATQENPVVDASSARQHEASAPSAPAFSWFTDQQTSAQDASTAEPARQPLAPDVGAEHAATAFADTISAQPSASAFPWTAPPVGPANVSPVVPPAPPVTLAVPAGPAAPSSSSDPIEPASPDHGSDSWTRRRESSVAEDADGPSSPAPLPWLSSDTAATAIASSARASAFSWFADDEQQHDGHAQAERASDAPVLETPAPQQASAFESPWAFGSAAEVEPFPTFEPAPAFVAAPTEPDVEPAVEGVPAPAFDPVETLDPAWAFGADAADASSPTERFEPDRDFVTAAFGSSAVGVASAVPPARRGRDVVDPLIQDSEGSSAVFGTAGSVTGSSDSRAGTTAAVSGGAGGAGGSGSGGSGGPGNGSGKGGGPGKGGGSGKGDGPVAGVLAWIRKNPRTSLIAGIAAGVVVLGGLSFGIGAATSPAAALGAPAQSSGTATATPTVKPTVRPTPSAAPVASKIRTCSVNSLAQDGRLGTLEAQVMNAKTGEVLFDRNGSTPAPTASVLKMLTAAAAFQALGPDYRVPTTVVKGSQPGQVVVIGGGDVTLSRLPSGQQPFYTDAPHVDDLANQVKQAWAADPANAGQPITSLVVDTSLYSGPQWQPSWDEREERVIEGSTPYMTSFMVDGDRDDPTAVESSRSTDPVGRAAGVLADDLGGGISVSNGTAPAGAKQLGQVLSQPVSALAEQALTYSDNTIMEELARLVAIKEGTGNSFDAINAGTTKALAAYGIDETGLYFADGSGLSNDNRVPPSYLTRFMVKVLNREGNLGSIYDGLPVAGKSGTLGPGYGRFQGSSSIAVGHVNAKTGWIDNGYTLSGVVHAQDGTDLTFAIFALGDVGDSAKSAIDQLTAGIYKCGNNLSNN